MFSDLWTPLHEDLIYFYVFVVVVCRRKNSRLGVRNVCCLLGQLVSESRLVSFHPSPHSVHPSRRSSIPTDPRHQEPMRQTSATVREGWRKRARRRIGYGAWDASSVTLLKSVNSYRSAVFLMCGVGWQPQRGGGLDTLADRLTRRERT